ncbi:MAG: hypothetical protein IJN67_13675 [Oscillospiraceae bacterium]|nr:hypothetical protein [Oscillospiraceae bacterium]
MKKNLILCIALLSVFALLLTGCGSKAEPEKPAASEETIPYGEVPPLGLQDYSLSASTWSSPNGATIHLTATSWGYAEGRSASFVVLLGEEEIANEPCTWDGSVWTASVELNAADGLSYKVRMAEDGGNTATIPLAAEEIYVNLASSLESYCNVMVEASEFQDGKLTITSGTLQIQLPRITNDGEAITVSKAQLILTHNGGEIASMDFLNLPAGEDGLHTQALPELEFEIPELENDEQVILMLNVTLSNGQTLTDTGSTFFYNDGELLTAVG